MSAESKLLQTARQLAAQFKPLIDGIPELQAVVSLQERADVAASKYAAAKKNYADILDAHNDAKAKLADISKQIADKITERDQIVSNAKKGADTIIAVANGTAAGIVAKATADAAQKANDANQLLASLNDQIDTTKAELAEVQGHLRAAHGSLNDVRTALESVKR